MSSERLHVIIRLPWTRPEGFVEPVQSDEFSPEPISFLRQSVRYRREGPHSENVEKPGVPLKEPVQQAGILEPLKSEDAKRSDGGLGGNSKGRRDDEDVGEGTMEERRGTTRVGTTELRTRRRSRTGFRSKVRSSGSAEMTSPLSDTSTFPRPGHGSLSSEPKSSETPTSDHPTRNNPFSLERHPDRDRTEEIRGESSANAGKYDPSNRPRRTSRSSSEETVSSPSSTTSFHSAFSTTTTENKTVDSRSSRHGRERVPWETRSPTTRIQHTSTLLPPSDMNETVDEPFPRAAAVAMRGFVPGRSLVNSSDEEDGDEKDEDQDEEEEEVEDDEGNEHNRYDTESLLLSGGSPVHGIHPETTDLQIHDSRTRSSRHSALSRRLSRLATMDEPAFLPPPTNGSESTTTTTTTTTLPTTGERTDPLRSSPNKIILKPRSSRIPPQLLSSAYFQDSFDTTVIRTPILTRPLQNISPPPSPETSSPSSPSFRHRRRRKPNSETAADLSPSESPPVTGSLIDNTDEEISDSSVTQSAMEEAYLSGLSKASSVSNA